MSFSRIVVAVDGAEGGVDALALARRIAAPGTELVAVTVGVYDAIHLGGSDERLTNELRHEALTRSVTIREQQPELRLEVVTADTVAEGLRLAAETFGADAIVLGSCRRGQVGRIFAGDDVLETLRGARCPVAIAPHDYALSDRPIVTVGVGWDGRDEGGTALTVAEATAAGIGAQVHALAVVPVLDLPVADGAVTSRAVDAPVEMSSDREPESAGVQTTVVTGDPAHELALFAAEVDLLIVGSHQRSPLARLALGSTAEHLTRHCRRPLLVVPRAPRATAVSR